jgi:uncharacterized OsmC-like protein
MSQVIVKIHSQLGIETEIVGLGKGRLIAERMPKVGVQGGMGFGGGEILCFAVGTCYYNNLRREANNRNIELDLVEIVVTAEWDDSSPIAHEILIKPHVESRAGREEVESLMECAIQVSSVANTVSYGAPVRLFGK